MFDTKTQFSGRRHHRIRATVSLAFTVKVDAGVPLGPTESGEHHVHLWLDNHANDYLVVESDTAEITSGQKATLSGKPLGVSPGMHTIHVSLRNANHSAAGVDTEIPIKVGTGTGPAPTTTAPSEPETSSEDPSGY